jgi:NAD(P)-dependent dehydrogenase (short-subunit alcohol dehydrogenase family)
MTQDRPLAFVTGGHHRLGARIAEALAVAGYDLAIHGSHDAAPDAALAACLAETGVVCTGFVADFADPAQVAQLMEEVAERCGRAPDVLVNSASIFGQDDLQSITTESLAQHHAVNCAAPVLLIKHWSAQILAAGRKGAIINLLDQRLTQPHGDQLAYSLSKFALEGFTRIAARTLAPQIRVNAVAPGLTIATDDYADAQIAHLASIMPLGQLPAPQDVAAAVLYLAEAAAVTGQTIIVDGGAHMKSYGRDFMHIM